VAAPPLLVFLEFCALKGAELVVRTLPFAAPTKLVAALKDAMLAAIEGSNARLVALLKSPLRMTLASWEGGGEEDAVTLAVAGIALRGRGTESTAEDDTCTDASSLRFILNDEEAAEHCSIPQYNYQNM